MSFRKGGGKGGGGTGNANIGALLRQAGETAQGLFLSSGRADYDWHMRGVERQLEEAAVPSEIEFENQDQDASFKFKAPVDWVAPPETVNTSLVRYTSYTAPRAAIAARYNVGAVPIISQQVGTEGNNDLATVERGTAAHTKLNAHADIEGDRGPSTPTTAIRVRSPDFGEATKATAQLLRSGPLYIKVDWNTAGTAGNGFVVQVERLAAVPAGQAAASVDRDGSSNVIGITVGVNGTVTFAAIVAAFNGVSVGGTQLVTATEIGGFSASRAFLDSTLDDSATLSGGAGTGFKARGAIAASSATLGVDIEWYETGPEGNGFEIILDRSSHTAGTIVVQYRRKSDGNITATNQPLSNLRGIRLLVNGTITRAQLAEALNGVVTTDGIGPVIATARSGGGAISYTNSAADEDITLSGGTSGTGAGTDFGGVTVTRAPDSDPPTAATATIDAIDTSGSGGTAPTLTFSIAPAGDPAVNIVITGDDRVGAGMGLSTALVAVSWRAGTAIDTTARSGSTAPRIDIRINGTVTAQTIVNLLNAYSGSADGEGFSAALASGTSGTTSVSWGSSDTHGPALRMSTGTAPSPVRLTGMGIEVTHSVPGTNGNNSTVRVTKGTPALPLNGVAGVVSKNAFGTGGDLMVRSPTTGDRSGAGTNTGGVRVVTGQLHTDPTGATADINVAPSGDTPVVIRITYTGVSRGTKYNGAGVHVGYDTLGGSDPDLSITAFANTGNISVTLRGTVTIASILTAFTGELAMSGGGTSGVHMTAQVVQNSGSAINVTWASTDVSVTLPSMAGAVDGATKATGSTSVSPLNDTAVNLDFTAITAGTAANNTRVDVDARSSAGVAIGWDSEETEAIIGVNGTYTLTALVTAINAADQSSVPAARRFTASVPDGVNGDNVSVTWASSDNADGGAALLSGGADAARDPLSAVWDAAANRLTVTVRDGDTIGQVRTTIGRLSEFQGVGRANSNDPGDVWLNNGAGANNQIQLDATAGNHIDYNFAGGTDDGIPRETLAADWTSPLLHITGVIPTDTVQNVIDIINGLSSAPTAAVSDAAVDAANDTIYLPSGNTQSQDYNFTGGAAGGGHSVRAVYTAATNTLALTALPNDTYDSVMDAIAALSQFQRSRAGSAVDGSMPGDIWLVRQATTLDIIDTPASTGAAALEYDFANGRDAADRSALTVTGSVDTVAAAATVPFVANSILTYYKPGTEGNGLRVRAQMRFNPDLAGARASATANISGTDVRFRWHNNDTFGNGWTVRLRRRASQDNAFVSIIDTGNKIYTIDMADGTYSFRELQNYLARLDTFLAHSQTNIEPVLGPVRMEVAAGDLDSEFTVGGTWTTIGTAAFTGAGAGTNRVVAEYVSARELTVSYETDGTAALQTTFVSRSDLIAAINAARWEGLQLVTASADGAAVAGPIARWPRTPPQAGDTVLVGEGTYTLASGAEGASLITITGIIGSDTAQNIADAYTGPSDIFTLPSGNTAVGTVTAATRASFTGGKDALGRQQPHIVLHDDGEIGITAILHDDEAANTTLRELIEAFWRTSYTNTDGRTVLLPFNAVEIDVTGGGATTDPIRNQSLERQGTGGSNFIPEGDIEALVRPDDESNGPNIEVRYHADHDTLQEILDALLDQGAVDVVDIYGTDLSAVPEDPPFVRDMWPESGDTNVTVTGAAAGLTFQDEGSNLGRGTTVNFTGSGVTVTGSGLTKKVNVRGVDEGETQRQVSEEVARDVKDFARTGGPVVPEDEIAGEITRDTEVASAFGTLLSEQALNTASLDDKVPFRNASNVWGETTTAQLRAIFKPNLAEWSNINGLYIFRVGDIVPHNGGTYYCLTEHTKNSQTGPDGDDRWLSLRLFWGAWTARFYPTGSQALLSGDLWLATEDVSDSERPGASSKWLRVTNQAGIVDAGAWSSSATYPAHRVLRHNSPANAWYVTHTATPVGKEPGVASDWATYYYRLSWIDGAPDSVTGFDVTGATFRANKRDGSHEQHTLPSGGTEVVANPAGSDGDILRRIDIGGLNFVIETETTVGRGQLIGRRTSTRNKFPADLPDHTDPIRVRAPRRYTDTWESSAASIDWPIVPITVIAEDGGFLSGLDATENSFVMAEGMYIIGSLAENIWINDIESGATFLTSTNPRRVSPNAQRLSVEFLVERYAPNAHNAMCRIFPQPTTDTRSYWYVFLEGGADGPAGNEWKFKVQYDSSVSANNYAVEVDVASKEIQLNVNGTIATTRFPDIIADLNGELNESDGSASGITISCIDSGRTSHNTNVVQAITWSSSDTATEFPFAGGSDWALLSESNGTYTRSAPYARQTTANTGTISTGNPGSDDANDGTGAADYDGTKSPVEAVLYSVVAVPPGGATVRFRMERGRTMALTDGTVGSALSAPTLALATGGNNVNTDYDALGWPFAISGGAGQGTTPWGYFCDVPAIQIYPLGRPTQTVPITPTPHITSFDSLSGDLGPAAGSIANAVYGYSYTIAQGSHVGAARIIGFKGATKPSGTATVLATLTDTDRGAGSVNIPADVTLAAGEQYRIRLQIFAEGVTVGPDTAVLGYHDIVIRAHAPATAAYHWGRVARVENQDAATYAAAIVFADSDLETGATLDTAGGYDATPDTTGNWIFYLAAAADETQPSGWTSGGFPANAVFQAAEDQDIGGVSYKVYVMNDAFYRTADDGTVTYVPTVSA